MDGGEATPGEKPGETPDDPLRLAVAEECGEDFRVALCELLASSLPGAEVIPLDGSPADAAVVGGYNAATDVANALAAGVRWIQTLTAGVDRVSPHLAGHELVLTNGAAATARPVSEFAMARVLEHAKQLPLIAERQRARQWDTRWLGALAGATITVVGLGPVGNRVARLANAFEMRVIGVRRDATLANEWCAEVIESSSLAAALAGSRYCVLAAALTAETSGMVSAAMLERAAPGLHIVNVGRGELIDHHALRAAAIDGRITAALDVFPDEPLPPSSPLWDTPGISVSAHTATLTPPLITWLAEMVGANAQRFARGEPLDSVVDMRLGYPARRGPGA